MALEIVPSVDLLGGQVVRLQQGDYARQTTYSVEPLQTAQAYHAAGARWLHVVDLDGARAGRPAQTALIARLITGSGLMIQAGGGVRTTDHVRALLDAGAARVVVGTRALEDWPWFKQLVEDPAMAWKIVLALDARDGLVATKAWTQTSQRSAVDLAAQVRDWHLAAILYTDVSRDGMLGGPNLAQTRKLAEATNVPVIASGGVGNLDHIRALIPLPIWGVIVGRSLYEGTVDLRQAIELARR